VSVYLAVKFVHILVAIIAVGSSAGSSLWMAATKWSLSLFWIRLAPILVVIVLVLLYAVVGPLLGRLIQVTDTEGAGTPNWKRSELLFEVFGGAGGLIIIVIVWLMVTKPS
jgi:uncharacterized membrane protein